MSHTFVIPSKDSCDGRWEPLDHDCSQQYQIEILVYMDVDVKRFIIFN